MSENVPRNVRHRKPSMNSKRTRVTRKTLKATTG